ncbi:MAG: hypothetical protein ACYDBB_25280 [Armatimonadota bacterium]
MKHLRLLLLLAALISVSVLIGSDLQAQQGTTNTTPPQQPAVTSRGVTENGRPVGEVLVNNQVVLRLREPAGGYTPAQRADIVAARLSQGIMNGMTWQNMRVGRQGREVVLLLGNDLLVTVDSTHARANATTRNALASQWLGNTQTALRSAGVTVAGTTETGGTGTTGTPTATTAAGQFPDWTNPDTKIVPILAVGTPGIRLGFAQVTGPRERVNSVRAVFQIDAVFQRVARIKAFVPSSNLTGVNRVQGVAVTALLQYQLFRF